MPLAGAATDGAAVLVTRVGKAQLNVKKYQTHADLVSLIFSVRDARQIARVEALTNQP
jgi:hypothetical protein